MAVILRFFSFFFFIVFKFCKLITWIHDIWDVWLSSENLSDCRSLNPNVEHRFFNWRFKWSRVVFLEQIWRHGNLFQVTPHVLKRDRNTACIGLVIWVWKTVYTKVVCVHITELEHTGFQSVWKSKVHFHKHFFTKASTQSVKKKIQGLYFIKYRYNGRYSSREWESQWIWFQPFSDDCSRNALLVPELEVGGPCGQVVC